MYRALLLGVLGCKAQRLGVLRDEPQPKDAKGRVLNDWLRRRSRARNSSLANCSWASPLSMNGG